jgi:hypothetical protein
MNTCGHCGREVPNSSPCDWFCNETCSRYWYAQLVGAKDPYELSTAGPSAQSWEVRDNRSNAA